jgi:hypothetical protein
VAGVRNMTVSRWWCALFSRSGHQSCGRRGAFKGLAKFRVSGVFRGHRSGDTEDKARRNRIVGITSGQTSSP